MNSEPGKGERHGEVVMKRALLMLTGLLPVMPSMTGAAAPPVQPRSLDAVARMRLDRLARRQPLESVAQERVNQAGNVPAWLLGRLGLPDGEELARARAVHLRIREKLHSPPASAHRTLARLLRQLPSHLRPPSFRYGLYLVERSDHAAFTRGGGFVYLSHPLCRALLANPRRGEAALAFVLARELGHIGMHHCRRGWQRVILEEELRRGLVSRVEAGRYRDALDTTVRGSGALVRFLYTRDQEYEADRFALQLCENAGYPADECLDGLRIVAALRHPDALRRDDYRLGPTEPPDTLAYYLSNRAGPLVRLRRLLMERDGAVEDEGKFGLLLYDRATGQVARAADGAVKSGDRPIIFVHGMKGGVESFRDFLTTFGQRRELLSRKLLVFRYPGNSSLARSGRFLRREVRRVSAGTGPAVFVCHSAGGLVFRYYAERLKGPFGHAILIATPHAGSDLTELKFLVDLTDLALGAVALGPARALAAAIPEGKGEITRDLRPDSLFLRQLGRDPRLAARYQLVVGEYLSTSQALALRLTFAASRRSLLTRGLPALPDGALRAHAARWAARLRLPGEVLRGDLIVSTTSATLPGAGRVTRMRLHHLAIRSDPRAIGLVLDGVLKE